MNELHEIRLINEHGEFTLLHQLRDEAFLRQLSTQDMQGIYYLAKELDSVVKKVKDVMKDRLDAGEQFDRVRLTTSTKKTLPDDAEFKKAMVEQLGWDAVTIKSPTSLQKQFGKVIDNAIDGAIIYEAVPRIKAD